MANTMMTPAVLNVADLRGQVQAMYERVAEEPEAEFHFEMGRGLAERLGYPRSDLDRIPGQSIESFAGVGYAFDLADIRLGETVLDLGSGSGMDTFVAALKVGPIGHVIGVDMTRKQVEKAESLRIGARLAQIEYRMGYLEELPLENESVDVVISNGVINLCPDKAAVFREVARVLRPGGRMAISDIVTERQLPENITCNANLWAACIGGAMQEERYRDTIEAAGLPLVTMRENPQYRFLSRSAQGATREYGVKSVSVLARR